MTKIDTALSNLNILIVEDEYLIARDLAETVSSWGASILGPCGSVDRAVSLLDGQVDAALLDINLQGQSVYQLADILLERNIPVIFVTGYDAGNIPAKYRNIPHCEKPMTLARIKTILMKVLADR